MKKRSRTAPLEMPPSKNETAEVDLKALKREKEQLLKAIERIGNEKQRLRKKRNMLFEKARSLNCILARSHREPEYLKRNE